MAQSRAHSHLDVGATTIPRVGAIGPFVETRRRGEVGWVHEDFAASGLEAFWAKLEPLADAKGRGGVGVLRLADAHGVTRELVVRPYRRGGALGALLEDRYPKPVRVRRELEVLYQLQLAGVPVVAPIAAVARRGRAFWRLRLCTARVPEAAPVPAFLAAHPERRRMCAEAVGVLVRLAFDAGLRHPDLHPDNVLVGLREAKVRAVLVDLDRARIDAPLGERVRDEMLVRMQRYVVRHRRRLAAVPSAAETMRFLRALEPTRQERHRAWRRLRARLERSLARRSWLGRKKGDFLETPRNHLRAGG